MRLKVAQQGNKENVGRAHAPQQPVPAGHVPEPHGMTGSLLGLQRTHGNRFVQRLLNGVTIQRKCACGGTCTKCQSESAQQEQHTWQHILQRTGSGQPLESGVMEFMETRFGEDFSEVRVHTDTHTAQTAQRLNAVAYTVGRDIFFGSGQYHPQTMEGKQLLAHELTHVVQQQHGIQRQQVGGIPGDQYEQEADKIAHTVVRRKRPSKPEAIADERMAQGTSWVNLQDPRGHVASIFFATNQTNLDDQDKRVLAKVYNAYRPGLPLFKVHMLFIGYVDYRGTEKYNSTLRHQRAQAVAKYFSVLADPRILYFPVKRVMFMPLRACHSVPLFRAAVCGGPGRLSASARWETAFCGVAQAAPPSLHNAPRQGAAEACPTSALAYDPRSP
jgi:outer membrane protein OmpA-like peptidoglycan-associated protein